MAVESEYLLSKYITFAWSKICKFNLSISRNQYILRLNISMKNSSFMYEGGSFKYVMGNSSNLIQCEEGSFIFIKFIKVAVHKLKDQRHLLWIRGKYIL